MFEYELVTHLQTEYIISKKQGVWEIVGMERERKTHLECCARVKCVDHEDVVQVHTP